MPQYAPEVWTGKGYGPESDIFSLGTMLYKLTTNNYPFDNQDLKRNSYPSTDKADQHPLSFKNLFLGIYSPIENSKYSDALKQLIYTMFTVDPSKRPTAKDLMNTPFMSDYIKQRTKMDPKEPKLFKSYGELIAKEKETKK
jgi:serine/threonine protein kinase